MKLKNKKEAPNLLALLLVLFVLCVPVQSNAAVILQSFGSVTVNGDVPTAEGVRTSSYGSTAVVNSTPSMNHYNGVFRLFDTTTSSYLAITSVSQAFFTLGKTNPAGSLNVNYNGTWASVNDGKPQFAVLDSNGVDLTPSLYGLPLIGTPLPAGATYFAVINQEIPVNGGGVAYNPVVGNDQTGSIFASLNYDGGNVEGTTNVSNVTVVPEPAVLTALIALGFIGALRRRRTM